MSRTRRWPHGGGKPFSAASATVTVPKDPRLATRASEPEPDVSTADTDHHTGDHTGDHRGDHTGGQRPPTAAQTQKSAAVTETRGEDEVGGGRAEPSVTPSLLPFRACL
jgi:hypothetical protein